MSDPHGAEMVGGWSNTIFFNDIPYGMFVYFDYLKYLAQPNADSLKKFHCELMEKNCKS